MISKISAIALAGSLASIAAEPVSAQDEPDPTALIGEALERARAASSSVEVTSLSCARDQREVISMDGAELRYPCMLRELVTDSDDASMVVTLLLSAAPAVGPIIPDDETPLIQSVAALGAAAAGAQIDPDNAPKRVDRYVRENEPDRQASLASFFPRGSETFRAEVARVDRLRELEGRSDHADDLARERAERRKQEAEQREAEYRSVTDFLNLAHAQGFCPADGRAFLARAIEYSTSPLEQDRMVGLWADERRHALEPYLNDLSRCR